MLIDGLIAFFVVLGTIPIVASAIAVVRLPDGLSRANAMGLVTVAGLPNFIVANLIRDAADNTLGWGGLLSGIVAIIGLLAVLATGSTMMARALLTEEAPGALAKPEKRARNS